MASDPETDRRDGREDAELTSAVGIGTVPEAADDARHLRGLRKRTYEVEDARLADGIEFLGGYFTIFFGVPGFKYAYKVYFPVEKALKAIGMG